MNILCCCGHLRSKKKSQPQPQHAQEFALPIPPPPAKLPPPVPQPIILSPGSTVARSSLTNPFPGAAADASVQFGELVFEDSDEDNAEHDDDTAQDSRKRSASTLHAVKSRIRRHMSQDSLSRQSESEEQIARRAEVKRLLRKRIQEELQSEVDILSSESSTPPRLASSHVQVAVNGPRDTIEFTVNRSKRDKGLAKLKTGHLAKSKEEHQRRLWKTDSKGSSATSVRSENQRPGSRAASVPDLVDASRISQVNSLIELREGTSLPSMPNSPTLLPVRGLSFHDASSIASWRLSLSADRLDDLYTPDSRLPLLRPVANSPARCSIADIKVTEPFKRHRSKSSPLTVRGSNTANKIHSRQVSFHSTMRDRIPASESLVRDESPVGLWLRTQNLQFRLSTTSRPPSEHDFEDRCAHEVETQRIEDAEAVLPVDSTGVVHTAGSSDAHVAFSSTTLSATVPAIESPNRSPNNKPLPEPPRRGLGVLRFPSFKWSQSSIKSRKGSSAKPPVSCLAVRSTRSLSCYSTPRTAIEASSETSSFHRRDAELRNVEERFRDSHLRIEPLIPVESKFKEMFDYDERLDSVDRRSLLLRLHLDIPKRDKPSAAKDLDGNGSDHIALGQEPERKVDMPLHLASRLEASDHGYLKVPAAGGYRSNRAKSGGTSLRSSRKSGESARARGFSSSKDGDETAQMWKRALRPDTKSESSQGGESSKITAAPALSLATGNPNKVPGIPQSSGHHSLDSSSHGLHSPTCGKRQSQDDEATFQKALERSNTVLRSWAQQLEKQEGKARERSKNDASKPSSTCETTTVPPASWAKFPSHNRHERNATAGVADNVNPKDFAVKDISVTGEVNWTTDRLPDGSSPPAHTIPSLPHRLTRTFKLRWSKIASRRTSASTRERSMQSGRRSSVQTGGDLEYPELELLPSTGGYKDLRALEREIDEMKGCKSKRRSPSDSLAVHHNRTSLTDKMASALQQHDGYSEAKLSKTSDTASLFEGKASMVRLRSPSTPATQIHLPDATHTKDFTGSTVERYATPFSHLSPSDRGSSSAAAPDSETDSRLPLTNHSPSSEKNVPRVPERTSIGSTSVSDLPTDKLQAQFGRARPRTISVPLPVSTG